MDLIGKILYEAFITKRVKSSNIHKISYDRDDEILRLTFHSGAVYEYYDVPKKVYAQLMKVKSKGKFCHRNIYWDYHYERIE